MISTPTTSFDPFMESYIEYATLHVPVESIKRYSDNSIWVRFRNIVALTASDPQPTGIRNMKGLLDDNIIIYDLNGVRLSEPKKGVNIINGKQTRVK